MKKIILVLLSFLLLSVVLFGCGKEKVKNPPLDPGSSQVSSRPIAPVTEEEAGEIALEQAKTESQYVSGYKIENEFDDGRATYDIEFYSDGHHYEVEIDPATGQIISYEKD